MDATAITSHKDEAGSILAQWRQKALTITLIVTLIVGIPSLVTSTINGMESGEQSLLISWAIYSVLFVTTILSKIRHQIRVWIFLIAGLSTAAINMWLSGLSGTGGLYLLIMPIYAFILAGGQAGWISMSLSLTTFFVFTLLTGLGNMSWPVVANPNTLFRWIGAGTVGTMLMTIAVVLLHNYTRLQVNALKAIKLQAELLDMELDSVYLNDFEGNLLYVNKAAYLTHGYTKEELLKIKLGELEDTELAKLSTSRMKEILEKGQATFEINHRHKNGSLISLEMHTSLLEIAGKKMIMSVARDITERKKIQQQMIAQDRLASIGQLVSGVAHEIKNPLTSIIGFSELLLQRELPADVIDDLKIVNDEAHRTELIVKGLLTYARNQPEGKQLGQVNEQIQKVLKLRNHYQKLNNIQVDTHFTNDIPEIMGNDSQLQQVFFNIIINAEHAMLESSRRGVLTITTEQLGNIVKVRITDDGPGISPENMKRLFTPFFTTKGVGKGTGLGLSICQGIITEHSGKLYAESEFGKGATFIVELPISQCK